MDHEPRSDEPVPLPDPPVRRLEPDEAYDPDRVLKWDVPVRTPGIAGWVGYNGRTESFWCWLYRDDVSMYPGWRDNYRGGRLIEVGDTYLSAGLHIVGGEIPQMYERLPTLIDVIRITWEEVDWDAIDEYSRLKMRDAALYERSIHLFDLDESKRMYAVAGWAEYYLMPWLAMTPPPGDPVPGSGPVSLPGRNPLP